MLRNDPGLFRQFVNDLVEWLRGKGRILIVTHDAPDPDALASEQQAAVVRSVEQHLLTPYGLRTLAPSEPGYRGRGSRRSTRT